MILSRRNLPLNAMRAFEAAARHCHLRKAAVELGVTHGAVSRQVKQLEELLAVELFDRSHNRLALTSAGQRLLTGLQEGLDKIAESTLYLDPESMSGSLTIASTPSISAGWLVMAMGEFAQRYPEIRLRLLNINPQQRDLPSEVDVAICYGKPDLGQRDSVELFRERYFPVCHPSLLRPEQLVHKPVDMLAYPILHDHHGYWEPWFAAAGIQGSPRQEIYFQDVYQVLTAVREGFGIGLLDRVDVQRELNSGQLVGLFDDTVEAKESHYLVMNKKEKRSVRVRLFEEFLRRHLMLPEE
ncbi:LysR substrate-binding domain-containing protein [Dasania sp. GY-MA-18]|uniref:LysR substrate-binding domain-containing protein n=1 Tax=Dasania phycosphaerae TaxID=2950436 RepID=A0A9J6RM41_9GAMM|nr:MULTISPECIES: LysR substrate-binding domain-containing protein [Dasania]MCR8922954.1 LysR substrate-binding domain-containing protein [Dasania sp. GY-MA-18]MCZ0865385.1 LysR substrate-binding domain-containing protein [Dasania phycosphaerae]MCZ0869110.1 LysR substrate-binding domain-containing protein [Dasania phycosphaerae]